MRFSAPLAVLLLAPVLSSQGFVSPRNFRFAEGNHSSSSGLGTTKNPARYMQVHEDVTARTIKSMSFRRDGTPTSKVDHPAFTFVTTIILSSSPNARFSVDPVFDKNHGKDKKQVAARQLYKFPKVPRGAVPHAFDYKVPFNSPFVFKSQGQLCWEMKIHLRTNTRPLAFDGSLTWDKNPPGVFWNKGTGCKASGSSSAAALTGGANMNWVGKKMTLTFKGANLPKNANAFLSFGSTDQSLGGLPLPFALPGTSSGKSGTCWIYADSLIALPVATDASGAFTKNIQSQLQPWFNGASLFTQVYAPDASANSLGLISSDMLQVHLVGPFDVTPITNVELHGSLGSTGKSHPMQGIITLFE